MLRRTPLKRTPMRTKHRNTNPDPATVAAVWARDDGCCARCGKPLWESQRGTAWSVQHRLPRGRGGTNAVANLVLACGSATTGCHGWMESQREAAYLEGWLLRTGEDPARVPVRHWAYGRVFLTDTGGYDTHGGQR